MRFIPAAHRTTAAAAYSNGVKRKREAQDDGAPPPARPRLPPELPEEVPDAIFARLTVAEMQDIAARVEGDGSLRDLRLQLGRAFAGRLVRSALAAGFRPPDGVVLTAGWFERQDPGGTEVFERLRRIDESESVADLFVPWPDRDVNPGAVFELDDLAARNATHVGGNVNVSGAPAASALKVVTGTITHKDSAVADASHLDLLRVAGGVVFDNCDRLTNVDGLSLLEVSSGPLKFDSCRALVSTRGLSALRTCGTLTISECESLVRIEGFEALANIRGDIEIEICMNLEYITEFASVESIFGNVFIIVCGALKRLDIFSNLRFVGKSISVYRCESLERLSGFSNLDILSEELNITANRNLKSMDAFQGLISVEHNVSFRECISIVKIDGLGRLRAIGGDLEFSYCKALETIDNMTALKSIGGNVVLFRAVSLRNVTITPKVAGNIRDVNYTVVDDLPRAAPK